MPVQLPYYTLKQSAHSDLKLSLYIMNFTTTANTTFSRQQFPASKNPSHHKVHWFCFAVMFCILSMLKTTLNEMNTMHPSDMNTSNLCQVTNFNLH
jgi:hypothetical protein